MIEKNQITEDLIIQMGIDLSIKKMGPYKFFLKYGIGIQTAQKLKVMFNKKLSTKRIDKK